MQQRIEEVFSPIFFHYPNGLEDRSVWRPRDTSQYIRNWRELAEWRTRVQPISQPGEHLTKDELTEIFRLYMNELKKTLRPEQLNKPWVYYKDCTHANLRNMAGSTFVANAIWAIGLPRLPRFATEQQGKVFSQEEL